MRKNMQYFKPGTDLYVGDPMPFFHDGRFHLYYLVDEAHHKAKNGLGGHYWAHISSTDLREWEQHPVALPLGPDGSYDQNTICTGCVYHWDGVFHAPYATRIADGKGSFSEQLCWARSHDGINFVKDENNPWMKAPDGFRERDFRDFFLFRDEPTGLFHMLATAYHEDDAPHNRRGCLLQYTSQDLTDWKLAGTFLDPGAYGPPECPDCFQYDGRYYLTFLSAWRATVRVSENPYGPWLRPPVDSFDGLTTISQKSAEFVGGRRIAVSFLPYLEGDKDGGSILYGGNAVFREIVPTGDGSLGCKFPPEMIPAHGPEMQPTVRTACGDAEADGDRCRLNGLDGLSAVRYAGVPANMRVTMRIQPASASGGFGVYLHASANLDRGYELRLSPSERSVQLFSVAGGRKCGNQIDCVDFGESPITLDIICKQDIIDVCVNQRRCIINRFPESTAGDMLLFCENCAADFDQIRVYPLLDHD